jgi:hypothetical protein
MTTHHEFDINIWWHWVFVGFATLGSAWNACRVFFRAYDASSSPFHIPVFRFFSELAGSFAGWMSLWYLLPLVLDCSGARCEPKFSWLGLLMLTVAVLGIMGQIPRTLNHLADGCKRLIGI